MTPVLVYDGDCAFCSTSARFAARWLRRSPADYAIEPWQRLDLVALGLTATEGLHVGGGQPTPSAWWHPRLLGLKGQPPGWARALSGGLTSGGRARQSPATAEQR